MNRIINMVAPSGSVDFVLKLILFLFLIGGANYLRDLVEHPEHHDSLLRNIFEASFVALPFCIFALALVRHMKNLQDQLVHLAATDMLTGLPNRRAFLEVLEKELPAEGGHLLMLDIDHFKRINDSYGHAVGDMCLKAMATHLKSALQHGDVIARLGGEEFGILLRHGGVASLARASERLVTGVTLAPPETEERLKVTNSVGATSVDIGADISELLRRADIALYQAKVAGRARMVRWDDSETADVPSLGGHETQSRKAS